MRCPNCNDGEIYLYIPAYNRYTITEDKKIIGTGHLVYHNPIERREVVCDNCKTLFDIDNFKEDN